MEEYVLTDFSYMMDENLDRNHNGKLIQDMPHMYVEKGSVLVRIIEEGLKIPSKDCFGETEYLDTKIQYKDEIYYTQKRFLKKGRKTKFCPDEIDFDDFLRSYNYIGVTWAGTDNKFMLVTGGPAMGLAVSPYSTLATKEVQKELKPCVYYVFDTKNELLEWMKD